MANVALNKITKQFRNVTALRDVSFEIKDGEFFVLLGPTGAGKTTALRVIAGLEKQDAGAVTFDGEAVDARSPAERDIAFVFQQDVVARGFAAQNAPGFPQAAGQQHQHPVTGAQARYPGQ